MKMEGGYHGSYELAEVSLVPRPNECGPLEHPTATAVDASFPDSVLHDTIICPYNEPQIAANLLQQSDLPIKEIAWQCGFERLTHFHASFKKAYKCSPRQLRDRQGEIL